MTVCKKCNGTGEIIVPVVGTMLYGKEKCDECNGTGKVNITNEDWFCRLSTKEKAKFLEAQQKHGGTIASRSDVDWEVWLKEKHE